MVPVAKKTTYNRFFFITNQKDADLENKELTARKETKFEEREHAERKSNFENFKNDIML